MKRNVSIAANLLATSVAAVLSASLIMSGTWAWQSFDQEVENKTSNSYGAGGRIHTNFNGEIKQVFVENYKDPIGTDDPYVEVSGGDIYVRVRLEEYLEIGEMAGETDNSLRSGITVLGNPDAKIYDSDTWDVVYMQDNGVISGFDKARNYVTLLTGASDETEGYGVYMPTFNKNDDSREGDVNGTLDGNGDKDIRDLEHAYEDYIKYVLKDSGEDGVYEDTQTATYDMDDNDLEEEIAKANISKVGNLVSNANIFQREETHETKETLETTKVLSMKDWILMIPTYEAYLLKYEAYEEAMVQYNKDKDAYHEAIDSGADAQDLVEPIEPTEPAVVDSPIGPYWVFDTDGWIYWAQPLKPQTATGLLLSETVSHKKYEGEWYYEISARAQYATRGDWGNVDETTGFYDIGVTEDALTLLQMISGTIIK